GDQVGGADAAAGAVAEQQRGTALGGAVQLGSGEAVRRLDLDRGHFFEELSTSNNAASPATGSSRTSSSGPVLRALFTALDTGRSSSFSTTSIDGATSRSATSSTSGSSQVSQDSRGISRGMRSWMSASWPIASVVRIVNVTSGSESGSASLSRQVDHSPA